MVSSVIWFINLSGFELGRSVVNEFGLIFFFLINFFFLIILFLLGVFVFGLVMIERRPDEGSRQEDSSSTTKYIKKKN